MGVRIDNVQYAEVYQKIKDSINTKGYICLNDVGNVVGATTDRELFVTINESLLSIADGMPLTWYAKLVGCRKIERITGLELMKTILEERNGVKHYLLGDTDDTISRVIRKAKKANSHLQITGHSPPFRSHFTEEDSQQMLTRINEEGADIVWISFGGGKQEKWMRQNVHGLNRGVMISVGAAFRYYIGDQITPPKMFQSLGLQWVFRTIQNPRKWVKKQSLRFLKFIVYFPWEVIEARSRIISHQKQIDTD